MRIESSSVSLYGASKSTERLTKEESFKIWNKWAEKGRNGDSNRNQLFTPESAQQGAIIQLSPEGKKALEEELASSACNACGEEELLELSSEDRQKIYLLQRMIEFITGKKLKFVLPRKIISDKDSADALKGNKTKSEQFPSIFINRPQSSSPGQSMGWGMEYELHQTKYESQSMSFSAEGTVKTSDGRHIIFELGLNISRESLSRLDISLRAGDAARIDPLVINFGNTTAALTNTKYSFDIDSDGTPEQISFAANGSGFLAFDINNDGTVNNGSELFGPRSGNGFSELAEHDGDMNGWIDENDEIYDKLRIWTKDENGNDRLLALGVMGIGAIYLGNIEASFDIKNSESIFAADQSLVSDGGTLGSIARNGIFLRENGVAGTIQHVDLAI